MTALFELTEFYGRLAWKRDENGKLHPTPELLADQGAKAYAYAHPSENTVIPPEAVVHTTYLLALADIHDACRDISRALTLQPTESRQMILGGACARLQAAEFSIRKVSRS